MRSLTPFLMLLTVAAASCVPYCTTRAIVPGAKGVVLTKGAPVADIGVAVVRLLGVQSCDSVSNWTRTDVNGRFQMEPIVRKWDVLFLIPADKFTSWHMCMQSRGRIAEVLHGTAFNRNAPSYLLLECDGDSNTCIQQGEEP